MNNVVNFVIAHWAAIVAVAAVAHTAVSSILGVMNKPQAETVFEQVWHYVQIAAGLGTRLATSKNADTAKAVANLTGDAANLANGK